MAEQVSRLLGLPSAKGAQRPFSGFGLPEMGTAVLVFCGYYVGSQIGFALTFRPHPVSVLWPPNSILLAALLLTPLRSWWTVIAAAFPAHCLVQLQSDIPPVMVLCYFVSNSCEALIGAGCIRYLVRGHIRFDTLRSTAVFCLFGGLIGPFLSSFVDVGFIHLNHWGSGNYWEVWQIRFCSNVLAALTFAPAIVMWFARPQARSTWRAHEYLEASFLFLGLIAVCYAVLYREAPSARPALLYAPLPFLLWAALRLGSRGVTSAILIVSFLAIWSAAHGHGPFTAASPEANARSLQLFLVVMAIPFLFLAAGIEERQSAEERFSKAFRCSPDAMWIARLRDATLFDVNEQWEKLFGYRREKAIGRTVFDLNLWADVADRAEMVARLKQGPVRDFEVCLRNKAGEVIPVLLSADIVEIGSEDSVVIIVRDISDRKRAEEANRNLAHASRLAVVGQLTASIAHEINQPLGAILSNADAAEMLLELESPPLDEIRQILADIRNDDVRASETIRHIRMLARKGKMRMESFDLNEVTAEVVRLAGAEGRRRKVVLSNNCPPTPSNIRGDRVHLQQVMMNLILNGMEAMSDTPEPERTLDISTHVNRDRAEVTVSDNGEGIPADKLPKLFDSFFTTKEHGVGLGLAIARSIIESHDGQMSATNNPAGGATFRFDLPLAAVGQQK